MIVVHIVMFIVIALILAAAWDTRRKWNKVKGNEFRKSTGESDDYLKETEDILSFIEERWTMGEFVSNDKTTKDLERLKESTDILSLSRYAHFGGVRIVAEQVPPFGHDPHRGKEDVFCTDLRKAARSRKEKLISRWL